jgi:hypothetical protein
MRWRLKHTSFLVLPSSTYLFTAGVEVLYLRLITLRHTSQSVGLLWTSDRSVAETSTWQNKHSQKTNIHAPGEIRTHDPGNRSAADLLLRPRGHWDRRWIILVTDTGCRYKRRILLGVLTVRVSSGCWGYPSVDGLVVALLSVLLCFCCGSFYFFGFFMFMCPRTVTGEVSLKGWGCVTPPTEVKRTSQWY